ncbi:MAG TPA: helix-turn-helix transcriptional regulator [Myxococcota bacterium]|nr:helix-turn-helix transcriptional regulator [Myxococcota bacterium]
MPIVVRLDVVMARNKVRGNDLSQTIGLSQANLSKLKTGRVKAIRFSTLEALCRELDCQPGDLLEFVPDESPGG